MRAFLRLLAILCWCAVSASAQELTALARVDGSKSQITDGWRGATDVTIALSQGIPYRVFLLDDPARLVVDFREADWSAVSADQILQTPGRITALRFGAYRAGWSRLVADLAEPMVPKQIGMNVNQSTGAAVLEIALKPADPEVFAMQAGPPLDEGWPVAFALPDVEKTKDNSVFTVVLDPGHGGLDPGAERNDVAEKDLMLSFARGLRETLTRAGVNVVLTRDSDTFVALETRVAIAHQVKADAFISLHADSLGQGQAQGATVYTLSDEASDTATAHLAARHDRADIIAGADLTGADDQVAGVLLDLARQETEPRSRAFAQTLVEGMNTAGGPMNTRPLRRAGFSVLKSADIPSVLVEIGFLSSDRDLSNLRDPVWRAVMVNAMADAILAWRDADAALRPLVRQ